MTELITPGKTWLTSSICTAGFYVIAHHEKESLTLFLLCFCAFFQYLLVMLGERNG